MRAREDEGDAGAGQAGIAALGVFVMAFMSLWFLWSRERERLPPFPPPVRHWRRRMLAVSALASALALVLGSSQIPLLDPQARHAICAIGHIGWFAEAGIRHAGEVCCGVCCAMGFYKGFYKEDR